MLLPVDDVSGRRGRALAAVLVVIVLVVIAITAVTWRTARERGARPYRLGAAGALAEDISQAVARVAPAVVRIDTTAGAGPGALLPGLFGGPQELFPHPGQGSGVIVNGRHGYVLTNAHVLAGARAIWVVLPSGRSLRGRLLGADVVTDIAVVQIRGRNLPEAELGSSEALPVGSWVIAVGNPFGLENTVTAGVLSAKGRTIVGEGASAVTDLLQTDAAINAGNSGGALIDLRGQVVGMPTAIVPYATGIGFAVASDTVKAVLPELVRAGKVSYPWLGIAYGTPPTQPGAVIERVLPDTPAARAGLRQGDLIVALDGRVVRRREDVARAMRAKRPGDRLVLTIRRGNAEQRISVRLEQRPQ
jgi:serine protease Do